MYGLRTGEVTWKGSVTIATGWCRIRRFVYTTICNDCVERKRAATAKACKECGEIKPKSAFGPHASAVDGLRSTCLECVDNQKKAAQAARVARRAAMPQMNLGQCLALALQNYGRDAEIKTDFGRRPI